MRRTFFALLAAGVIATAALAAYAWIVLTAPLDVPGGGLTITARPGSTLTSVAADLDRAGVSGARWLPWLARLQGSDRSLKAGRYRIPAGMTLPQVLDELVSGRVLMSSLTIVEGWTFGRLKAAIRDHPDIEKTLLDLPDAELLQRVGVAERHPEGLFFPDTYRFASGTADAAVLRRAYQTMQQRLAEAWQTRKVDVPYAEPYEALIVASLIEKETGRPEDRPLIASVFVNRLKAGMKLQTDPSVIYGLGAKFDGNLRRRDLDTDQPYNTYTRAGLPPTPIALPGQASLQAALQPPPTRFLYFVARGDGSSEFSASLDEHSRAVDRYQRGVGRRSAERGRSRNG